MPLKGKKVKTEQTPFKVENKIEIKRFNVYVTVKFLGSWFTNGDLF